ncbi:hypothetical protein [Vulcaniibacterium tengchongense]|uniref:Lipoprotein n=1 Tax=Vulcaniibacterium tengchongense TaxID=1273429 RepID=A0A3N4VL53_9GAMM|nr:hypothetical protein [Vulcaniibacterium tengchongense]RPE79991.1 hypothetical protein EDC50_1821 [Vulcaniibacterium tengchongense]
MIRKLLLPALAAGLLAGCVTDYAYRGYGGRGDYYYGRPSVEYRYHGGYYGGYGWPYYGGYYGYPYRYGYYGYPYYGYRYRPPYHYHHHRPRPPSNTPPSSMPRPPGKAPWRDLDSLRPRGGEAMRLERPGGAPRPAAAPRPGVEGGPRPQGSRAAPWRQIGGSGRVRTQER